MNTYLDVAVVQIQSYLTRAPSLRGRRGGSAMVTAAADGVTDLLADRATPNPEAGQVDGVVSLQLAPGTDTVELAQDVLAHLRRELPAAALVARRFDGDTYSRARSGEPTWQQQWHAMVSEWPLAKPCDWCRSWPAGPDKVEIDHQDGRPPRAETHCLDCARRATAAGYATARHAIPAAERRLLERFPGRTVPDRFDELAALTLGPVGDESHLATVYADGNRVGAYMRDCGYPRDAPRTIQDATWKALQVAVGAINRDGSAVLPVIPHLVGGDDLLCSVPAHGGWDFVLGLLPGFDAAFTDETRPPTLSAAMVIHHRSEPLADVVDLAGALLKAAKRDHPGRSAIAWQSITHDGPTPIDWPTMTLTWWQNHRSALAGLAAQSGSQRQQLAALCRDIHNGRPADLDRQLTRMGLTEVVAPFRETEGMGMELEQALAVVRWWAQ